MAELVVTAVAGSLAPGAAAHASVRFPTPPTPSPMAATLPATRTAVAYLPDRRIFSSVHEDVDAYVRARRVLVADLASRSEIPATREAIEAQLAPMAAAQTIVAHLPSRHEGFASMPALPTSRAAIDGRLTSLAKFPPAGALVAAVPRIVVEQHVSVACESASEPMVATIDSHARAPGGDEHRAAVDRRTHSTIDASAPPGRVLDERLAPVANCPPARTAIAVALPRIVVEPRVSPARDGASKLAVTDSCARAPAIDEQRLSVADSPTTCSATDASAPARRVLEGRLAPVASCPPARTAGAVALPRIVVEPRVSPARDGASKLAIIDSCARAPAIDEQRVSVVDSPTTRPAIPNVVVQLTSLAVSAATLAEVQPLVEELAPSADASLRDAIDEPMTFAATTAVRVVRRADIVRHEAVDG